MQKETNLTVGRWCNRWFCENQGRWSGSTVGGYRNLIYHHILPESGVSHWRNRPKVPSPALATACGARDSSARSVWCIHLFLCVVWMKRPDQLPWGGVWMKRLAIMHSIQTPVRLFCQEPQAEV